MLAPTLFFAGLLALAQPVFSRPVVKANDVAVMARKYLSKRAPAGPKIGGANFPDPAIIGVNNRWYAFATRTMGGNVHIQVAESADFESWSMVQNGDGSQKDALPNLPGWVDEGNSNTWAPDVHALDDGTFVMYYSATTRQNAALHCVGVATSNTITGPYTPAGDEALICPLDQGGAIDASVFNNNGQRWITWKVDGNAIGNGGICGNTVEPIKPTPLRLQRLSASGTSLVGSATTILDNNGASDQGLIEAPALLNHAGTWFLFFSANCYTTEQYNVAYATASSVTGPYTRAGRPLFQTGDMGLVAPGGGDAAQDGRHFAFHAREGTNGDRAMYTALLNFDGNTVSA
ncbi:hypothetical protein WHR41_06385 [Cladosporium halotolerans]|uniref:Glycoside hydrolase family 43 protein n=1 Tax=Cladosporium halotolerans TaxID=1052096 RepID=A0AB34KLG8_9PEZI